MNAAVITGGGVVSPVAQTPSALHEALCSGVNALRPLSAFAAARMPCELGAVVQQDVLARELSDRPVAGIDRMGQLTIVAARRALDSTTPVDRSSSLGLVLGTMFAGAHTIGEFDRRAQTSGPQYASPLDFANTVLNAAAGQAAIRLSLHGANITVSAGHTSGLQAIGYAADLVSRHRADVLLAGGADELSLETYLGYGRAGMLCGTNGRPGHLPVPFDRRRTGLALGEGAAFVVVERAATAKARGAGVRAIVAGHATAMDPDAFDRGRCGRAVIASVIVDALARAGVSAEAVDAVSASANGSYDADEEEAAALAQVFGARTRPPAITAIKSVLGETLGAAGPLQVISAVEAMSDGRLPGIRGLEDTNGCAAAGDLRADARRLQLDTVLVTAVSPEGNCCAVVLRRPEESR